MQDRLCRVYHPSPVSYCLLVVPPCFLGTVLILEPYTYTSPTQNDRSAWFEIQQDRVLSLVGIHAALGGNSSRDPSAAHEATSRHDSEARQDDDAYRAGDAVGAGLDLKLSEALKLIRDHGKPALRSAKRTGMFLYRGETLGEAEEARLSLEPPDLLDERTYGSTAAAEYFAAVDAVMMSRSFRSPVRPSIAHIAVSDRSSAAEWGTACSVWPLGDTFDFAWLDGSVEWWNSGWEVTGYGSPFDNSYQEAFFWRDRAKLRRFLRTTLRVNTGLAEASRRKHEVLFRSGFFSFSVRRDPRHKEEGLLRFRNAFVCIPASMDDTVRAALGIPAPGLSG